MPTTCCCVLSNSNMNLLGKASMPRFAAWFAQRGDPKALLPVVLLIIVGLDLLFLLSPVALPRAIGSFGLAALFISALAVNACLLTLLSHRWRVPLIPVMLGAAVLSSYLDLNDNHVLRTVPGPAKPKETLVNSFARWFGNRPDLGKYPEEYPVYIVAAQGGGIYASYQAGIVLARLQDRCPEFRNHLFAISSVSGGSVGAAMFQAALKSQPPVPSNSNHSKWCRALFDNKMGQGSLENLLDNALTDDHLSPLIAAALFPDFTQRFLPFPIPALDRARALEKSFEDSLRSRSDGRADLTAAFDSIWRPEGSLPALLINTTDAGTGMRYLIAPFDIPALDTWTDRSVDNYPVWGKNSDLRLSSASVASARFPWVTPAALVPPQAADDDDADRTTSVTRLVDGGYVDNSGVETALDVITRLAPVQITNSDPSAVQPKLPKAHFILIAITTSDIPTRTSSSLGETLEPLRALLSTRSTRSYLALGRAFQQLPRYSYRSPFPGQKPITMFDVRPIPLSNSFYKLPLGWRLSHQTANIIRLQSGRAWDCEPTLEMTQSAIELSRADCVQSVIAAEISGTLPAALNEASIANYDPALKKKSAASRFDHEQFLRCYVKSTGRQLTYAQARSGEAMLKAWDQRPDLKNINWLAFMMAVFDYNTINMSSVVQHDDPHKLIQRYGPGTRLGRSLGNLNDKDAIRYVGRGFLFLTGRYNYEAVARGIGIDIVSHPELLMNPDVSAQGMFYWILQRERSKLAPFVDVAKPDWESAWSIMNRRERDGASKRVRPFLNCLLESSARAQATSPAARTASAT